MSGVPESVFRIIEALKQNGLQKICFDDPSAHSEFIALRNALDTGKPINLCNFSTVLFFLFHRMFSSFRLFPDLALTNLNLFGKN